MLLTKRTQKVALEGVLSNQCFVTSGVPQGTFLWPLLFLIYIEMTYLYVFHQQWGCLQTTVFYIVVQIACPAHYEVVQNDLDALAKWERLAEVL